MSRRVRSTVMRGCVFDGLWVMIRGIACRSQYGRGKTGMIMPSKLRSTVLPREMPNSMCPD
jgi:hypothetical protein